MASITSTISIKDKASIPLKKLTDQLREHQADYIKTTKVFDNQNKKIISSEAQLAAKIRNLQAEKRKNLLSVEIANASRTKKEIAQNNKLFEKLKETNTGKEVLLKKDIKTIKAHYNEQIETAKQNLEEIKKINNKKRQDNKKTLQALQNQTADSEAQVKQKKSVDEAQRDYKRTYVNTKEINNYEDAVEKLDNQLEKNLITQEQYHSALSKEKKILEEVRLAAENLKAQQTQDAQVKQKKSVDEAQRDYKRTYVNTKEINNYEDAVEKLDNQLKRNLITQKQYDKALKSQKESLKKATLATKQQSKSTQNLANQTIRYLRWAGTIAGLYYAINRAWGLTLGKGIEINKMMEANANGIAALTSANTRMIDSLGNTLNPIQKFILGHEIAKDVLVQLRKEALKTPATFAELTGIYQQATGQTLAMGDAFGETVEGINKNTIKLSQRFSLIADAIGQPMDRVKEEIRSTLTGNVSTDSIIATMIFGTPTEANAQIKDAKTRVNGLVELLDLKLKPFDILSDRESFTKSVNAAKGAWEILVGDMVQKSGMFQDITDMFYAMAESITEDTSDIVSSFDDFYEKLKKAGAVIKSMQVPLTMIASYVLLKTTIIALTGAVTSLTLASKLNPFIIAATGAFVVGYTLADYITSETEKIDSSTKLLGKSFEEYNEQTIGRVKRRNKELLELLELFKDDLSEKEGQLFGIGFSDKEVASQKNIITAKEKIAAIEKEIELVTKVSLIKTKANDLAEEEIKKLKETSRLITKLAIDEEVIKNIKTFIKKEEEELVTLNKQKAQWSEAQSKTIKKLIEEESRQIPHKLSISKLNTAIALQTEGILATQQRISEITQEESDKITKKYIKTLELEQELETATKKALGIRVEESEIIQMKLDRLEQQLSITRDYNEQLKIRRQIQEEIAKLNKPEEIDFDGMDRMESILDMQIELAEGATAWGDSLNGVSQAVANILKGVQKLNISDLKFDKTDLKLQKQYAKDFQKANGDKLKEEELYADFKEDQSKLKESQNSAELAGYSSLAGAMSSAYEQGTAGAIAFAAVQSALGIASSWAAIAQAWSLTFPLNIAAAALVTANVMPIISQLSGGGGGGGGVSAGATGVTSSQTYEQSRDVIEMSYQPQLDKMDRQIELLESINLNGSASSIGVRNASATFEKDYETFVIDLLEGMTINQWASWGTGESRSSSEKRIEDELGFNLGDLISYTTATYDTSLGDPTLTTVQTEGATIDQQAIKQGYNAITLIEKLNEGLLKGTQWDILLDLDWAAAGVNPAEQSILKLNKFTSEFQGILADFTLSIIDSLDELKSAKDTFTDIFDDVTGTDRYAKEELNKAFSDIEKLTNANGTSFAGYLEKQIDDITALEKFFTKENIEILLLEDPTNLHNQIALVKELEKQTGITFENGATDALNYLESIELVGEAMSLSKENIKSFTDSFKTSSQITKELFLASGETLAQTSDELSSLFLKLATDIEGLNDNDLNLLEANKAYLEELKETNNSYLEDRASQIKKEISLNEGVLKSLSDVINKFKTSTFGIDYSLEQYYESMTKSLALSTAGNIEDFSISLKDTIAKSKVLEDVTGFTSQADQEFAKKVAINQFERMEDTMITELSVLQQIELNTRAMMDSLGAEISNLSTSLANIPVSTSDNSTSSMISPTYSELEKTVNSAYGTYLGRESDESGKLYWMNQLDKGVVKKGELGQTFISGAVASGELTRREAITKLYQNGFRREPDEAGLNYWDNSGKSIAGIIQSFSKADEKYTPFAKGGIVTAPTLGLVAEAGYNEAIIPLKNPNDPLGQKAVIEELINLRKEVKSLKESNIYYNDQIERNTRESRYA